MEIIDPDDQEEKELLLSYGDIEDKLGVQEVHLGASWYFIAQF